jgi:hypothetical protein
MDGGLARDVKNLVRVFGFELQHLDCVDGGQDKQFDFLTLGFALYSLHDGQSTVCTSANDNLAASPGDFLFYRERSVAELLSKFLRRLFLALADFAAINDDIMFVRAAIDLDGAEREFAEAHTRTPAGLQALFFDVIALKADRHGSTSLLPQCGQRTSPSS